MDSVEIEGSTSLPSSASIERATGGRTEIEAEDGTSKSTHERIVVVGGGMSAHRFVESLVNQPRTASRCITLLCEESTAPYDRVQLGEILRGRDRQRLTLRGPEWYADHGVQMRMKERVRAVHRSEREVETDSGTRIPYDRLVIATGGAAFLPPVPGHNLENVVTYRTIEDAEGIARRASEGRNVVIAGGGLLGLEAARSIQKLGCRVEIIEMAPRLLPRQLDVEGAEVLAAQIRDLGIGLRLLRRIEAINEFNERLSVSLMNGETLEADFVVFASGTRPRDDLAREAGLECHREGGIHVDDTLTTSDDAISAIGECVRHDGDLYGFVAPCYEMAEVLADRFSGMERFFRGATASARLKMDEVDVASVGDSLADGPGVRELSWTRADEYRRIVLREGRIVGAIAVGAGSEFPKLQDAVARGARVRSWQERRFARSGRLWRKSGTPDATAWSDDAILCTCTGITCGRVRSVHAQGCRTSQALSEETGAGQVCGSCRPLLEVIAGERATGVREGAGIGIGMAALVGLTLISIAWFLGPLPMSTTLTAGPQMDVLWRDPWWKQVSGFSLLALCFFSLGLSLRKRWVRLSFGSFSNWRLLHSGLGVATILGAATHTGLRMGNNLNLALMLSFVGVVLLGSFTALVTSLEHRLPAPYGGALRRGWTWAHVLVFWPMPVLILFHVLAVYLY